MSDFRITLVDRIGGDARNRSRAPVWRCEIDDPLAAHAQMVMTLKNDDMHNVTAYLETLK